MHCNTACPASTGCISQLDYSACSSPKDWERIAGRSRLDSTQSPVAIVEFSDYECPFCRQQHLSLTPIVNDPRLGGVAFRHLPLAIHKNARGAALSVICAEEQGRFRELHDQLFRTDAWIADSNWTREAVAAGVGDTIAFRTCRISEKAVARLQEDMQLARELNVAGTPSFLYASGFYEGILSDTTILRIASRLPD